MTPYKPALVYTPCASRHLVRRVDQILQDHRLYRLHLVQETPDNLSLPVDERPVLRRLLYDAATAQADAFLTDHITSLGDDEVSQVAVVGALLHYGLHVRVMDEVLPENWYTSRVRRLGYPKVAVVMDRLIGFESLTHEVFTRWTAIWPVPTHLLPALRYYDESRLRVRDLIEDEGLSFTQAAPRLMVEGYRNAEGRVLWYTEAVRKAYEAGL